MRRLIVEIPMAHALHEPRPLHSLKSLEILHILKLTRDEFAALYRIEFEGQKISIDEMFPNSPDAKVTYELLEEKGGAYTYFVKVTSRPGRQRPIVLSGLAAGGYISLPFEVKDGKLKVTFVGTGKQVKEVLESLERARKPYKVVSLMDARFSPDSPLARLTKKQRDVLKKAYVMGYYDRPRRIGSEELARGLGLAKSTLVAHRRKAERRLLTEVLSEA